MKALIPGNSTWENDCKTICVFLSGGPLEDTLYIVLDKFAMRLAFRESSKGSPLSKKYASSYFGYVKNYLLKIFHASCARYIPSRFS
ncbi:hypothetical protein PHMEG_00036900 [Phytophthora megakarya]|uniref:Uncharacterized protein n=1 Tax=Phytophthora megakarya TaxID=4795 RepID=A0A225UL09_9STRA|nr:hypothetical protein PHMEG_00036900 [Phytophthora megakarya]